MTVATYRSKFPDAPLQDESIIMKGDRNPFFGKHHTDEVKQRQRELFSGRSNLKNVEHRKLFWSSDAGDRLRSKMKSPEYRKRMSEASKSWWENASQDEIDDRFRKIRCTNITTGYWISDDERSSFELYRFRVRNLSQITFRNNFYQIENAALRGKGFELDHIISIYDGFKHSIPERLMSSVRNLRMIPKHDNCVKGKNSHNSIEALYEE